ncbi:hypothetical protein EMPS_01435 [Entomortierella parvispora]|uniref:Uncharacterized protein n=1 Tax=Entomortierella parvispora TaxID=205924 RepID=A0A9P3H2U7_9FUNG|nr:hypothetical protein EMPS_01435 [Entomortierella parvispora]
MSTLHPPALLPPHPSPPYSVAVFVLERFSKHCPVAAPVGKGSLADSTTNLQQPELHFGVSSSALAPPTAAGGRWPDRPEPGYLQTPLPQSDLEVGFGGGKGGSVTRSRPSGFGQSVAETKEQSTWVHLSAPQHSVTLKIHRSISASSRTSNFATQAQPGPRSGVSSLDAQEQEPGPELLIQSGKTTLDCIGLDTNSLRQTKLKGLVKGSMIGFRYNYLSPGSNVVETRKFQVKFRSQQDCGQCASILSLFIECRTTSNHNSSAENTESRRLGERLQRTESRLGRAGVLSQSQDCGVLTQQSGPLTSATPQYGSQSTPVLQGPDFIPNPSRGGDFDQLLNMSDEDLQKAIDHILANPNFAQLASKIQRTICSST